MQIVHVTLDNYEPEMHNEDFERGEAHHNWVDEVVRSEGRAVGSEFGPRQIRPRPDKKDPSSLTRFVPLNSLKVWLSYQIIATAANALISLLITLSTYIFIFLPQIVSTEKKSKHQKYGLKFVLREWLTWPKRAVQCVGC